jgi:hypothetical protein
MQLGCGLVTKVRRPSLAIWCSKSTADPPKVWAGKKQGCAAGAGLPRLLLEHVTLQQLSCLQPSRLSSV